jgi:hypothetical protein
MQLRTVSLAELAIDDERSVAHVAIYARLKRALERSGHRFFIPAEGAQASWDRVLFLNLTYWDPDRGTDVFCDHHVPADVVAHMAWHAIVGRELARQQAKPPEGDAVAPAARPTAASLFFAESIASAFDLYLIGRLLHNAPDSDFITTQVPLLAACAEEAGLSESGFATLLQQVAQDPERAFEDLRALLLDVSNALFACRGAVEAQAVLDGVAGHRFEPLLHHYQLSNWILYARAYAAGAPGDAALVASLDAALREKPVALDWLADNWIDADLTA